MKLSKWLGLLAALNAVPSWSQEASHAQHQEHVREAGNTNAPASSAALAAPDFRGYISAFSGYRLFVPDEPLKNWRAANDEVRAVGRHMGPMKDDKAPRPASDAAQAGHGQAAGQQERKP